MEQQQNRLIEKLILFTLISLSIVLLVYSFIYLFNYYSHNDILLHVPNNIKNPVNNLHLQPNEIGDSIGGILNPVIGFTACILTFLAFYIQYRANETQKILFEKQILNEKTIKDLDIRNRHVTNLKFFKALVNSCITYYSRTGEYLIEFSNLETTSPLLTNKLKHLSNSSYENYQKLNLVELYGSMVYYFKNKNEDWEEQFEKAIGHLDYYHKVIIEINETYKYHVKKKSSCLVDANDKINITMSNVFTDSKLKNMKSLEVFNEVFYNLDKTGQKISADSFKEMDFEIIQTKFLTPFIKELEQKYNETKSDIYRETLLPIVLINKKVGYEKIQAEFYAYELRGLYDTYFTPDNQYFNQIKTFINKIDLENISQA
jgi:hypothetical protein